MDKGATIPVGIGMSVGLGAAGIVLDRRRVGRPLGTAGALGVAAAYLVGTFHRNAPLFGRVARPRLPVEDRRFSLTFDDGPDPRHTPEISALLASRDHRATFFVLGRAAREHPELIRMLASDGHEVACHGDDHRLLAFAPPSVIVQQLDAWEEAVEAALGRTGSTLLRTPHGFRSPWLTRVARNKGYVVCGWDGSVFDTAEPGAGPIVNRVVPLLRPGAVVLLHDGDGSGCGASRAQTVAAIEPILTAADVLGLRSTTLGSLLGPPEVAPLGAFALSTPILRSARNANIRSAVPTAAGATGADPSAPCLQSDTSDSR